MTKKKSKKDIKAERKMLVSVIEKAVRSEKENSLDDFPALVVANERRIKQLNLTPGVKLSQEGEWRWRGIKEHLGLQKKGNYWLPSRGSKIYKRNQLFEIRENLLARPNNLPILDIAIIVKHYLDHSLKWLEQKIEEDNQSYVQPSSKIKLDPDEIISKESDNDSKPKIERQDLALMIWKACLDLEKNLILVDAVSAVTLILAPFGVESSMLSLFDDEPSFVTAILKFVCSPDTTSYVIVAKSPVPPPGLGVKDIPRPTPEFTTSASLEFNSCI